MLRLMRVGFYKHRRCDKIDDRCRLMNFLQIVITEESLFSTLNGKHRA